MKRTVAAIVLMLAITGACGGPSFRRERASKTKETSRVGTGVGLPNRGERGAGEPGAGAADGADPVPGGATGSTASTDGAAVIDIRDPRGPGRSGVPLLLEGGSGSRRFLSGAGGRTEVKAPPGNYLVSIETGCTTDLEVVRGATGRLDLAFGDVATGQLTVDAKPRYRPVDGAYWPEGEQRGTGRAHWRPGEVHIVEVSMADACRGPSSPFGAEGAPLGRLRFVAGEGVELAGPSPTHLDAGGRARVRLRCTGPEVDVAAAWVDPEVPEDAIPLVGGTVFEDQATPFCTSS